MGEYEDNLQPSKKRAAGRELNRDRPELDDEEEDTSEVGGTFKKASEEVLATRRIVKVRRIQTTSAPTSNPFAGIRLVLPTADSAAQIEVVKETGTVETDRSESKSEEAESKSVEEGNEINKYSDKGCNQQPESKVDAAETESAEQKLDSSEKKENDAVTPDLVDESTADEIKRAVEASNSAAEGSLSSFQQLSSSKNAFTAFTGTGFTGFSGTGFSSSTFSFGSIPKDGFSSFGVPTNGNWSIFGGSGSSNGLPSSSTPSMQEVTVKTGEEKEKVVFTADSMLFEFANGSWKERGKGEIKVNVGEKARLVMRAKGNFRLILNASLYPEMKLTDMDKKGVTFSCINSVAEEEANPGCSNLTTFAVKFKDPSMVEKFREAVSAHKGSHVTEPLKTPEDSPKAPEGDDYV